MKKIIAFTCLYLGLSICLQAQDPVKIIQESHLRTRIPGLESQSKLELFDNRGNVRIRETTMASRIFSDGTEKRVIMFTAPPEVRGTGILVFDYLDKPDAMWIYLPVLGKTRQIVSGDRKGSFMGSEFSNADLATESTDDFKYESQQDENIDGISCYHIKASPNTAKLQNEYGYAYRMIWVAKSDFIPRRSISYDQSGKAIKQISYNKISKIDKLSNKYMVVDMEALNLKNNRRSQMSISALSYNPEVPVKYFTLQFLETKQQ